MDAGAGGSGTTSKPEVGGAPSTPSTPTTPTAPSSGPKANTPVDRGAGATTGASNPPHGGPTRPPTPGATTPSAAGAPAGAPTKAPGSGLGATTRRASAESPEAWQLWWRWNCDPYLRDAGLPAAPSTPFPVDRVQSELLPKLVELLSNQDAAVIANGLLAIARVTPRDRAALVSGIVQKQLDDERASVRDAALLALGILGDPASIAPLAAVLHDDVDGRRIANEEGGVSCNRRQLAALSLGLVGGDEAAVQLLGTMHDRLCPDLAASVLLAAANAAPQSTSVASHALRVLGASRVDATARAHAAIALSRLRGSVGRAAIPSLLEIVADRDTPHELDAAAIVALGLLAVPSDEEVTTALVRRTDDGGEPHARELACVALGRLLERNPADGRDAALRVPLVERLASQGLRPDHRSDQPWALLALGLALRNDGNAATQQPVVTARLRELVHCGTRPDVRSTAALALGLMRDRSSCDVLLAELADRPAPDFACALLQAIGMTRSAAAAEPVRKLAFDEKTLPAVRIEAARALALMGDAQAFDGLVKLLEQARGSEEIATLAHAVGTLRTARGIEPLGALLADTKLPALTRCETAAALAELAEKEPRSWWCAYSIDHDIHLRAPTLRTLLPE